jgi:membrane protease YdiL (CAAX protease family)
MEKGISLLSGWRRASSEGRKRIVTFLVLTFAFSAVWEALIIRAGTLHAGGGLFVLGLMWSPGIAALITTYGFQRSFRSMGWRLGKPRYLLVGYGLPIVEGTLVYGVVWLIGLGVLRGDALGAGQALLILTLGFVFSGVFALGEEIGWRGLLVPELARITSFTNTALISGAIWAVWHWPIVLLADYNSGAPWWFALPCFTATAILASFALAWLRLRSGSLWPAVVAHAGWNLYVQDVFGPLTGDTGITEYVVGEFGFAFVLTGIPIAYLFWRLRHRLPASKGTGRTDSEAFMH